MTHRLVPRQPTGVHRYAASLARALARSGNSGYFVATPIESPAPSPSLGVPYRPLPWARRRVQLAWSLGRGPVVERELGDLDLVHLLHPFPPVRTRAPLVVTIPDLTPIDHPSWFSARDRLLYGRSVELAVDRAQHIVAYSEAVATTIRSRWRLDAKRVTVIPLAADERFGTRPTDAAIAAACRRHGLVAGSYVLHIGALVVRKNLPMLVRAVARLPRTVTLVLAGPGGNAARDVAREAERCGVSDRVRLVGHVDDDELAALLGGAALLAHPSHYEGFGLTLLEAMRAGVPVIAACTGAQPEVVGSAGLLLAPSDVAGWTDAMLHLIDRCDERERLAAAGRARAATFTWSHVAEATARVHRGVIAGAR
ncbi:MAG TPA: glycosyltransferase family 1 protein [Vicinamibacterales bacterium]|nr:glycosyltransferase family 1 protein [Vicinamibacterales bacterium]